MLECEWAGSGKLAYVESRTAGAPAQAPSSALRLPAFSRVLDGSSRSFHADVLCMMYHCGARWPVRVFSSLRPPSQAVLPEERTHSVGSLAVRLFTLSFPPLAQTWLNSKLARESRWSVCSPWSSTSTSAMAC